MFALMPSHGITPWGGGGLRLRDREGALRSPKVAAALVVALCALAALMPNAYVWGWDGVLLGSVCLFGAILAAPELRHRIVAAPGWRRRKLQLAAAFLPLCACLGLLILVGNVRTTTVELTVSGFSESNRRGRVTHYVWDTAGRKFPAHHSVYRQVQVGEHVRCRATNPPLLGPTLDSCAPA